MKIENLFSSVNILNRDTLKKCSDIDIFYIFHDSRKAISENSLFICKKGVSSDGHEFALQLYEKGIRYFLAEHPIPLPCDAIVFLTPNTNAALPIVCRNFYNDPSKELKLIGITGTKGKTTTALLIYFMLNEYGIHTGYIGTNGIYFSGNQYPSDNTTPEPLTLQSYLRKMVDSGVTHVVIEVSSQSLWQDRINGLNFDICAFTNLYPDHIGGVEHPTIEHYRDCKKLLFTDYSAQQIVINKDSPEYEYMLDGASTNSIITVSSKGDIKADLYATDCGLYSLETIPGADFHCHSNNERIKVSSSKYYIKTPGLFNIENALLAIAISSLLGVDNEFIHTCISHIAIPGRFESHSLMSVPGAVFIIDYAHNGISLSSVLSELRKYNPNRIICLFGSVGGRTFSRRKELGKVACELADISIITSDNPANEDPMNICNDISNEFKNSDKQYYLIPDRETAIKKAIEIAQENDFVLLAGKGHENYQLIGKEKIHFSEREILEKIDWERYNNSI